MNTPIMYTPHEIISAFLAFCGAIVAVSAAVAVVVKIINRAKEPEQAQDQRITTLEDEVKEIKSKLNNDNERITRHEESERIMMKALKALLSHGIDGNNTEEMSKAASALDNYLIEK